MQIHAVMIGKKKTEILDHGLAWPGPRIVVGNIDLTQPVG